LAGPRFETYHGGNHFSPQKKDFAVPQTASTIYTLQSFDPAFSHLTVKAWFTQEPTLLSFSWEVRGPLDGIQWAPCIPMDELWKSTCFEAFVQAGSTSSYYELNISPTLAWSISCFESYRTGKKPAGLTLTQVSVEKTEEAFLLTCGIPWSLGPVTRMGLVAILEVAGTLTYWAQEHEATQPDFHASLLREGSLVRDSEARG